MTEYWHATVAALQKQIDELKSSEINVGELQLRIKTLNKQNEQLCVELARIETRARNSEAALRRQYA